MLTRANQYRWIVNVTQWEPSDALWEHALGLVEPEEQKRIQKFHFPIDAKRSLIGRLMMRKVISVHAGVAPNMIKLARCQNNKPYWANPTVKLHFNVSHHSHYVILVAHATRTVGCDIMSKEISGRNKDQHRFFDLMKSSFSDKEWLILESRATDREQLSQFFTFWTLKESFIKNIGVGLGLELNRMNFHYKDQTKTKEFDSMVLEVERKGDEHDIDAKVYDFEQFALDDDHTIAICMGPAPLSLSSRTTPSPVGTAPPLFTPLTVDALIDDKATD